MDQKLLDDLVHDEGFRLVSYKDTQGYWTIGIGHLLGREKRMTRITIDEALVLCRADVDTARLVVQNSLGVFTTDEVRMRALINMAFNRGNHMVTSTTITPAIKKALASDTPEDWKLVTAAIVKSEWASQVKGRATRIAQALEIGAIV